MDRAYEGNNMRAAAKKLGYHPIVPPKKNRVDPWECDKELYKRRNEVERFFRRIKRFRRVLHVTISLMSFLLDLYCLLWLLIQLCEHALIQEWVVR